MAYSSSQQPTPPAAATLDVRELAPRLRLARMREALDALSAGQALCLVSDRDPRPFCERLQAEQPGRLGWRYLETGPAAWRVELRKGSADAPGARAIQPSLSRPAAVAALEEDRQVHLDVRPDIARGEEPLTRIMAAVRALGEKALVLRAPFEPVPLYGILGARGLGHWAERRGPADWVIWFYRETGGGPDAGRAPGGPAPARLDVRGLEPPQPMVRVLEAVEALGPGQALEVLHDRRPMFLYPQLEERGFLHQTDEPAPGVVRIVIQRPAR